MDNVIKKDTILMRTVIVGCQVNCNSPEWPWAIKAVFNWCCKL